MNNKESILFSLKTTSINFSSVYNDYFDTIVSTPNGIVSNNRCSFTWYNINIRNIIGNTIYEKYDRFNITLNSVIMSSQGSTAGSVDARTLYIKMSGLPWIGNTKSPYEILNVIQIPVTPSASYSNNINNGPILTFSKNADNVNINIVLHSIEYDDFDFYVASTELFGHFSFIFNITGVIEDDINIERNRMMIK